MSSDPAPTHDDTASAPDAEHPYDTGSTRALKHVPVLGVDSLLDDPTTRIVVCCGSGGVGKTTTAAALGLRAAERGRKVVVLTIDPARRLAQSMGIDALDNTPRRVKGIEDGAGGELHAMMLDMKRTFDEIVEAHADPERAAAILGNPFYQSLSAGFAGTQEYMAMEKLGQLRAREEWDLIVVDTPPSRSALDFLDAPKRLGSFLDGKLIRVLMAPAKVGGRAGMKFLNVGMSMMTGALGKLLGGQLLKASRRSWPPWTPCSAGSARVRTPRTSCCRRPARRSWWSRRRSGTRCARRRTSWSVWPPRTCRWRVWCSTGSTAAAQPGCRPSGHLPRRKILKSPALWISRAGRLHFVTLPTRMAVQNLLHPKHLASMQAPPPPRTRTGASSNSPQVC
jgi:hypothetical protein